jgi:enoyl-CoA hydratase/carnithine racemase
MSITLRPAEEGIAELVLDRPERLNAFQRHDIDGALAAVVSAAADPGLRALVVRGTGRAFCAGADRDFLDEVEGLDPDARLTLMRPGVELTLALARFPRPTVAAVQGACYGGGVGLALACDIVVAAPDLRLGLIFTELGLPGGDYVVPWLLSRRVGTRRAWRLLAEGAVVEAVAAANAGLVDEVAPAGAVTDRARTIAAAMAARPPAALAETKRQVLEIERAWSDLDEQVELQLRALARAFDGAEYAAAQARRRP